MPVPIERPPKGEESLERCCLCREYTGLWTAIRSRTPGEQVACCHNCANVHTPQEVPSKAEWFKREMARMRTR